MRLSDGGVQRSESGTSLRLRTTQRSERRIPLRLQLRLRLGLLLVFFRLLIFLLLDRRRTHADGHGLSLARGPPRRAVRSQHRADISPHHLTIRRHLEERTVLAVVNKRVAIRETL